MSVDVSARFSSPKDAIPAGAIPLTDRKIRQYHTLRASGLSNDEAVAKLSAAALDFTGPGAVEIGLFEKEIVDLVRRESPTLAVVRAGKASGQPHRYLEQTGIATGAFVDPRNVSPTATGPTRVEKYGTLKAITAQSNLSQFDVAVTKNQGIFEELEAKDILDVASACVVTSAGALWDGTDTSLSAPTTLQYMGLLRQVTQQATIKPGASIIDGIKRQVALMMANETYKVRPDVIFANPLLIDYIEQEAKAMQIILGDVEVAPGVHVMAINTQAGKIPIVPDPYIPTDTAANYGFAAPAAGFKNYYCMVGVRSMLQRPYMPVGYDSPFPQIYQLGLTGNLQGQFVGVLYDCIIAMGASYAHSVIAVVRP